MEDHENDNGFELNTCHKDMPIKSEGVMYNSDLLNNQNQRHSFMHILKW